MNLTDSIRRRVQRAYEAGEDVGTPLARWLGNPVTRALALQGMKSATRSYIQGRAKLDGMPRAVIDERIVLAEVLFENVADLFARGMSPTYRRRIPEIFLGQTLLPARHKADEVHRRLGIRPPKTLVISPNMTCNLSCFQCYAPAIGTGTRPEEVPEEMWNRMREILDPAVIRKVVLELHELGSRFITITGGEPLAYFHKESGLRLVDGSGKARDVIGQNLDTMFLMYTNGKGIDAGVAARLAETGNVIPCLSLEGMEASTDRRRGAGTFQAVMRGMDLLREHGVPFGASITVFGGDHANAAEVVSEPFVRLLKEKGARVLWYFPWFPTMAQTVEDLDLFPAPVDRFHTLRKGILRIREHHRMLALDFSDGLMVNEWEDGAAKNRGCIAAGIGLLSINQDGSVDPCAFVKMSTPDLNVKTKSLEEILAHPYMARFREFPTTSHNPLVPCFPRDHLDQMREAAVEHGAVPSSPKWRICRSPELDESILEYNARCREIADAMAAETYGFDPNLQMQHEPDPEMDRARV